MKFLLFHCCQSTLTEVCTVDDLITADIGLTVDSSAQLIGRGGGVVGEGRTLPSLSFPLCLSSAVQFSLGGRLERVLLVSSSAFLCGAGSEVCCVSGVSCSVDGHCVDLSFI